MRGPDVCRTAGLIMVVFSTVILPGAAEGECLVERKVAIVSREHHILYFERKMNGPIFAKLRFAQTIEGVFGSMLPVYAVDGGASRDLIGAIVHPREQHQTVWWQVSDESGEPYGALLEFMSGNEVVFQYYLPDGVIQEVTFLLDGAYEAIGELLRPGIYE